VLEFSFVHGCYLSGIQKFAAKINEKKNIGREVKSNDLARMNGNKTGRVATRQRKNNKNCSNFDKIVRL